MAEGGEYEFSTDHVENTAPPLLQSNFCTSKNLLPSNRNVFTELLPRNGISAHLAAVA
jgi:hypothetical protein